MSFPLKMLLKKKKKKVMRSYDCKKEFLIFKNARLDSQNA